jgi:SAM-dependent methyltransferase
MPLEPLGLLPTFRDPSGSVEIRASEVVRLVYASAAPAALEFLDLPLAHQLVIEGSLIATRAPAGEALAGEGPSQPLLLHHDRVSFISYPWEWPTALWTAAAELTLDLNERLVKQGWILKDATPMNILFRGSVPVFVDVLSIQPLDRTKPIWYPYAQFVRMFLLPLLAHARLGWPLQATLMRGDGYDPEDLTKALPWFQKIRQPALSLVTLPMLLSRRKPATNDSPNSAPASPAFIRSNPELTTLIIAKSIRTLRRRLRQVVPGRRSSVWSEYTATAAHYTAEDHAHKQTFIENALAACRPSHVLDVGCNTGVYSNLAADAGAEVVAIDSDMQALDRLAVSAAASRKSILPLCVDLARPTPAAGWRNEETASFLDRCEGHFDTVMMLAVLHHLLLRSQIPMGHIANLCSRLTTNNLIVEWVPPRDPMFRELVRGREELYSGITEDALRDTFAQYFATISTQTLRNGRVLYHMRSMAH